MLQLEQTAHASVRVRQRGLRETDIWLIMELGTEVRPGMFMITKKDADILIREICSVPDPQNASWLGMSVCAAKGRIAGLRGCAVIAVASTAVSVTAGAAGLAADAVIGTARVTGKAVGAAADADFVRELLGKTAVTVLPGSYVGRTVHGVNPGQNRIRIALVAPLADCVEAAHRIAAFVRSR